MLFPFIFCYHIHLVSQTTCVTCVGLYILAFCGLLSLLLNCYYRGNRDARFQLQVTRTSMSFSLFARTRRNKEDKRRGPIHQKRKEPHRYNKSRRECEMYLYMTTTPPSHVYIQTPAKKLLCLYISDVLDII
jgi:hypothetical protein